TPTSPRSSISAIISSTSTRFSSAYSATADFGSGYFQMPIVLVHGAWSGGWSWSEAARILRRRGYEVYNPSLSGLAERDHIHPDDISLSSHISDIAGLMHYENLRNVLLVGHSYGGMVI